MQSRTTHAGKKVGDTVLQVLNYASEHFLGKVEVSKAASTTLASSMRLPDGPDMT